MLTETVPDTLGHCLSKSGPPTPCIRVSWYADKSAYSQTSPKPDRFSFRGCEHVKQAPQVFLMNLMSGPLEFKDEQEILVGHHCCYSRLSLKVFHVICPRAKETEETGWLNMCDMESWRDPGPEK